MLAIQAFLILSILLAVATIALAVMSFRWASDKLLLTGSCCSIASTIASLICIAIVAADKGKFISSLKLAYGWYLQLIVVVVMTGAAGLLMVARKIQRGGHKVLSTASHV